MTIPTTYSELQTEIIDWTKRGDQASRVPLYIAMAESGMNARLRLRIMETTASLTLSSGNDYVALPSGFIQPVSLVFTSSAESISQIDRESLDAMYGATGRPNFYSISGSLINFDKTANTDYALTMRYVKRLDIATDLTNGVLTAAPFSYMYGALAAYSRWIEDGEGLAQYTALFQQELRQLEDLDRRSRGDATLRTGLEGVTVGSHFDITTG